jgi:transposase
MDRCARSCAREAGTVILLSRAVRVYFATQPTNLRLSFEGLTNQIRDALGYDPLSGHVFVFLNRRRNQVKLILWTRGGFTIVHKRLEPRDVHVSQAARRGRRERRARRARARGAARGHRRRRAANQAAVGTDTARALDRRLTISHIDRVRASRPLRRISAHA